MRYSIKGNYFDGQYHSLFNEGASSEFEREGATDRIIKKVSPANYEDHLWSFRTNRNDVEKIAHSAYEGFLKWRKTSIEQRIELLQNFKKIVAERKELIATAIALETGKPYWEALTEVAAIIGKIDVTINDSLPRIRNIHIQDILPQTQGRVTYRPIGPCVIIGPFNFPCHLANGQITSALIAGNSIIFKPSEKTAFSGQMLFDCYIDANFPLGSINLLQGDGEITAKILKEKHIKGIFFTGSVETGRKILAQTHQDLSKLVALELGGKNVSILHHDANLEHALPELIRACFLTTGQRCTATGIVAIHRKVQDQFIEQFHQIAKKLHIDHPIEYEKEPFMGPLIDQQSCDNYLLYMGMAKREKVEEIMRGKMVEKKYEGAYVTPSIHLAPTFDLQSHFVSNEIFGPNVCFIPYDDIEEATSMVNGLEYGLASAVFTKEQKTIDYCLEQIDCGLLNINRSTVGASAKLPFGGIRNSGNYRPAALTTIDACSYPMATLEVDQQVVEKLTDIKGIY